MKKKSKRPSVISVGKDAAEIRIYTLRRKADGYTSYQCAWYSLGARATKVFAELAAAKTFAQQKTVELANGRPVSVEASFREIEILRGCEARVAELGVTLTAAIEEWSAARRLLGGFSLVDAARAYAGAHAGIKSITLGEAADLFVAAKEAAQVSDTYVKGLRCYFRSLKQQFGPCPIADVTTQQLDRVLQSINVGVVTKNNIRRTLVTLFKWTRDQGYLQQDRKTVTVTTRVPSCAVMRRQSIRACATRQEKQRQNAKASHRSFENHRRNYLLSRHCFDAKLERSLSPWHRSLGVSGSALKARITLLSASPRCSAAPVAWSRLRWI